MPFLREQRASYDYDVVMFFMHGHPAYFGISIRCTTQPAFSSCALCTGVAVADEESAKDEKYLAAGGVRFHSICCGNIWSLDTICSENFTNL